ncbi:helix-turn-helix domain-containing protein [Lysinibacter cavernae]|uniref:Transcriptional regulator with XRE-family HTH domain n=1 Tax=Lysinibacter cavernae TaxID=1640652 RepID=A0A7X5TVB8_9MICO|nr:helix-turn-helix transcriptional regulator [Lysinibacter cavernae]NIH54727.1 transcriptional regulator with XRE-family HTH domain [Lysinibacter cavernae]
MSSPRSQAASLVGERIRAERHRHGVSQMELAELASMHFTSLGKIERGEANPSLVTLVRIAAALNVDPAVLVAGLSESDLPSQSHGVTVADLIRARRNERE